MPKMCLRMDKQDYLCPRTCSMQSMPNNSSLAWVGHGHHQRILWRSIESFSSSEAIEESWRGYLITSSPYCTRWYSNTIHLTCPKKKCIHLLTLQIGMLHLMAPSSGCLAPRFLHMSYHSFPLTSWSCKRFHTTSRQCHQQDCKGGRRHHGPLFLCGLGCTRSIPWKM